MREPQWEALTQRFDRLERERRWREILRGATLALLGGIMGFALAGYATVKASPESDVI